MNITPTATSGTTGGQTSSLTASQASASLTPIEKALQKADVRIQSTVDATTTQLSLLGTLKSAVSNVQIAGHALHNLSTTASDANIKTAANDFALVFNNTIKAAKTTLSTSGTSSPWGSSVASCASRTVSDLHRAITSPTLDSLKKIGFSMQSDGTLSLDTTKFDAAQKADPASVRTILATVGQQVDTAATKELATGGSIGVPLASLNQRATSLNAQQAALTKAEQTAAAAAANATSTSSAAATSTSTYGVGAYLTYL